MFIDIILEPVGNKRDKVHGFGITDFPVGGDNSGDFLEGGYSMAVIGSAYYERVCEWT